MRARTCCELVLHQDYYLTPDKLDALKWEGQEQCKSHKQVGKNAIVASSANYENGLEMNPNDVVNTVFELDCLETSRNGQYSNMWHVHALSSVMKSSVHCIYPELNFRIRNAFHKLIVPRMHCSTPFSHDIIIMWTQAAKSDTKSPIWIPNHFVPCIRYTPDCVTKPSNALLNTQEESMLLNQQDSPQVIQYSSTLLPEDYKKTLYSKEDRECKSISTIALVQRPMHKQKEPLLPSGQSKIMQFTCGVSQKMSMRTEDRKDKAVTECVQMEHSPVNNKVDASSAIPDSITKPSNALLNTEKESTLLNQQHSPQNSQYSFPMLPDLYSKDREHVSISTIALVQRPMHKQKELLLPSGQSKIMQFTCSVSQKMSMRTEDRKEKSVTKCVQIEHSPVNNKVDASSAIPDSITKQSKALLNTQKESTLLNQQHSPQDSQYSFPMLPDLYSKDREHVSISTIALVQRPMHKQKEPLLLSGQSKIMQFTCSVSQKMSMRTEDRNDKAVTECVQIEHSPVNHKVDAPSVYSQTVYSCISSDTTSNTSHGSLDVASTDPDYKRTTPVYEQELKCISLDYYGKSNQLMTKAECNTKTGILSYNETLSNDTNYFSSHEFSYTENNDSYEDISIISDSDSLHGCSGNDSLHGDTSDSDSMHVQGSEHLFKQDLTIEKVVKTEEAESNTLPFPLLLRSWYMNQGRLFNSNARRTECHKTMPIMQMGEIMVVKRSSVCGSTEDNLIQLKYAVDNAISNKQFHKVKYLKNLLKVGKYIIEHGPIVLTQNVARVYSDTTNTEHKQVRKNSTSIYDIITKHFNVIQIYVSGKAYLVADTSKNIELCLSQIVSAVNKSHVANEVVKDRIAKVYEDSLDYIDTPRDKQVLKGIMSILTNITFTSHLEGKKSRSSVRTAFNMLPVNLDKYDGIKNTSQIVRSDLTCIQQYLLTKRIIKLRKLKEIKIIGKGRGRHMKTDEMPELPLVLEYAFGDYDTHVCSGGGLESHPRLTDGTLYRTADSRTTMKDARKLLLAFAPLGFTISLSSCYNYTMSYRSGSAQAIQHHHGRGVNANISLQLPPRTAVQQIVINLHWSTSNVNLIVDAASLKKDSTVVMSKDAKAIVCGDISPVQRPGRCWKKRTLPDHTWDQSRVNAITPMTFLFMDTAITHKETFYNEVHTDNVLYITRSGQAVSLLYLSFYEPDTTFKCLNEFLYLLTLPSLDVLFRNPNTGKLKDEIIFVVDNGPSEQPSSPMVQMLLVRLLKFLGLKKILQVSFAEYHSKRNFVERVHASENFALSRHGPFSSTAIHPSAVPGTSEHKDNMEAMASEVKKCLNGCTFSGNNLQCFRGIRPDEFIFNDEKQLKTFLDLTEERKLLAPSSIEKYKPVANSLFQCLIMTWKLNELFCG